MEQDRRESVVEPERREGCVECQQLLVGGGQPVGDGVRCWQCESQRLERELRRLRGVIAEHHGVLAALDEAARATLALIPVRGGR